MHAEIIAIGSELLTPHRTDTNSLFLTEQLNGIGVEVIFKTIVGDDCERLTATISLAWNRSPIVITIGGLGPTEDDVTRESAARALGKGLLQEAALGEIIESRFQARGMRMPEINLRQAKRIEGAAILENPKGTAPGQWIEQDGKVLILLPGPPRELESMFLKSCLPRLCQIIPKAAIAKRVLRVVGLAESAVEEVVAPIYTKYTNPATTILAAPGEIQLHLKGVGETAAAAEALVDELLPQLEEALGESVFSTDGASLEEVVGKALEAQQASLAVAESCTGGLLAERITSVSGSSRYFAGAVVCYSNAWKEEWLEVSSELLQAHGAVSRPVSEALAKGIRRRSGATYGVGITGIAGPTGGTPEKPVGLVYIALDGPRGTVVLERRYFGEREIIRWQATQSALDMLRRTLAREDDSPKSRA
ncbi:MAG: competence/damage-inducible protein A [Acidobacteria bacterium]|nr:competence/damage-inducible protein A [Acidobacteriota bacterium]